MDTLGDVPVKPAVRRIRHVVNHDDPRFRRTRAQICAATLQLLDDTDVTRLTFAQVASRAEVNRSTVHQHYGSRHELIADAFAHKLAAIAEPLTRCRFDDRGPVPAELVEVFTAARAHRSALSRLGGSERGLLAARLSDLISTMLAARFADGARPDGYAAVPAAAHADYVAGGLTRSLLDASDADPQQRAERAWALIAPVRG